MSELRVRAGIKVFRELQASRVQLAIKDRSGIEDLLEIREAQALQVHLVIKDLLGILVIRVLQATRVRLETKVLQVTADSQGRQDPRAIPAIRAHRDSKGIPET